MSNKQKKIKNTPIMTDEQEEIRRFVILLITVILIVIMSFVFTKYVVNDGDVRLPLLNSVTGSVNANIVTAGTMLNKSENEYYVMAFSSEDIEFSKYEGIIGAYKDNKDALNVYHLDTANALNEKYLSTEENPENLDAKTIEELSFGKVTLIKIKDNKINKIYSGIEDIKENLK